MFVCLLLLEEGCTYIKSVLILSSVLLSRVYHYRDKGVLFMSAFLSHYGVLLSEVVNLVAELSSSWQLQ